MRDEVLQSSSRNRVTTYKPTGPARRLIAAGIDICVICIIGTLLAVAGEYAYWGIRWIFSSSPFPSLSEAWGPLVPGLSLLEITIYYWLVGGTYHTTMESSRLQATIGKIAIGAKVSDIHHTRISAPRAILRFLAKLLTIGTLMSGFFIPLLLGKTQALHDKLTGCLVVGENKGYYEPPIWW